MDTDEHKKSQETDSHPVSPQPREEAEQDRSLLTKHEEPQDAPNRQDTHEAPVHDRSLLMEHDDLPDVRDTTDESDVIVNRGPQEPRVIQEAAEIREPLEI